MSVKKNPTRIKGIPKNKPRPFEPEVAPSEVGTEEKYFDVFSRTGHTLAMMGGKEKFTHDVDLLMTEWCIKGGMTPPNTWLLEKGYSVWQVKHIFEIRRPPEWWQQRDVVMDKMTESTVKRHIDIMAEVQETHIKASKLGLAKAIEMLATGTKSMKTGKDGKNLVLPLRSSDLLNCLSAVEKAQNIYRKAMGLPNEEGGLQQILDKVSQLNVQNNITENHLHVHGAAAAPSPNAEVLSRLTYDEIREFIAFRREQKKLNPPEEK